MKATLLILLCALSFTLAGKDNPYKMNCKQFRTGRFVMNDEISGKTIIDRYDSVQVETMLAYNCKVELHIKWVNECTYLLTFSRVLKDPDNNTANLNKTMILTNSITDVTDNSYTQTTSSNVHPNVLIYKITKVK